MLLAVIFLIFTFLLCGPYNAEGVKTSESLKVTLSHGGGLMGRYMTSKSGRGIKSFLGISYAEPPVGPLRFKDPVPKAPWTGYIDARDDSVICPQPNVMQMSNDVVGKEDCLYLHVYAPLNPTTTEPLPVMVFIHGGGFMCGGSGKEFYGPDYLLDFDVIYVAGNYRVGILGFLSTNTEDCPGNFGLKDQVAMLEWVQEHISSFGGDPSRVTIFGESAGGASVSFMLASNLSKGLFQQAIVQSGTHLAAWALTGGEKAAENARTLAGFMDCDVDIDDNTAILECLREKPASNLTAALSKFYKIEQEPEMTFGPVIEPDIPGAFISQNPLDIKELHGMSLPVMTGITLDEGAFKSAVVLCMQSLLEKIQNDWDNYLERNLFYEHLEKTAKDDISERIKKFYFNNNLPSMDNHQNFTNIVTDRWFLDGLNKLVKNRFDHKKAAPTYVYLFAHRGEISLSDLFSPGDIDFGVGHADDLMYLFPFIEQIFSRSAPTNVDVYIQEVVTRLWINFVTTGNPTPEQSSLPKWSPANKFPLDYLRIGNTGKNSVTDSLVAMETGLMEERSQFWNELNEIFRSSATSEKIKNDEL